MDNDIINYTLQDFERMRVSALTKAVELTPFVKEVTIGPNSPKIKTIAYPDDPTVKNVKTKVISHHKSSNDTVPREEQVYIAMLREKEDQSRSNADAIFKSLLDNMVTRRLETMEKVWKKQAEENERKSSELKNKLLNMVKEIDQESISLLEEAKTNEKNSTVINRKTIESMNRILEEQNKSASRFASITDSHTKVCIAYNDIIQTLFEESTKIIKDKYLTALNIITTNINNVMELCKNGVITDKEVKQAEILAANIENIKLKIYTDVEQMKQLKQDAQTELKVVKEDKTITSENKNNHNENDIQKTQVPQAPQPTTTISKVRPLYFSETNYRNYENLRKFLLDCEANCKELTENVQLKKYKFDCQKAVNTPINTLSSLNGMQIGDKYEKLLKLLKGETVQVVDVLVSTSQHPLALNYCTALLAKKIVRQGDLLVSSNPQAAFPLAAVAVALWTQFPELGKLIEANFQRECPYIVPMYLPQKEGQTDKEFYMSRGYIYDSDGVIEKQDKFLKRMSGVFRLCCAIWISQTPKFINAANPHGLRYAWRWLASFINLKPEPDISATLLFDFFTVCGSACLKCYGKQFTKVIKLICTDYLKILENIDEGGPKTRLEEFLREILKSGTISPPIGALDSNTW